MSIKISELPEATSVGSSDIVPIVQGGTTKKITANTLLLGFDVGLMEIYLSSNHDYTKTATWQWEQVPFDTIKTNIGSGLSFSSTDKAIVIGANISLVEINWIITTNLQNPETSSIGTVVSIEQNGTQKVACNAPIINQIAQTSSGSTYLSVAQGDKITVRVQTGLANSYRFLAGRCVLSVKVLKATDTVTRSLNLTKGENTGSLVGLGDKAEVTDETLEKTKLDEVTEVKEEIKDEKGSGDNE